MWVRSLGKGRRGGGTHGPEGSLRVGASPAGSVLWGRGTAVESSSRLWDPDRLPRKPERDLGRWRKQRRPSQHALRLAACFYYSLVVSS